MSQCIQKFILRTACYPVLVHQYTEATKLKDFGPVIDDDVARMLQVLITLVKKKLEIGTSVGFSTVSMAKSVRNYGGQITTIEFDAKVAEQALQNFEREMVAEQIKIRMVMRAKLSRH